MNICVRMCEVVYDNLIFCHLGQWAWYWLLWTTISQVLSCTLYPIISTLTNTSYNTQLQPDLLMGIVVHELEVERKY